MEWNEPSATVSICISGTRAEYEGRHQDACVFYQQAWNEAKDDVDSCIAAHYLARCQDQPEEELRWNLQALSLANRADSARVAAYYPSLYLSLGKSYEKLGNQREAAQYYNLAAELGLPHDPDYNG